jgi:hypothetical protein
VQEGAGQQPYDVATRSLIEGDPVGWLTWIGLPVNGPVEPVESDVDTVIAQADKVIRVNAETPWLAHLEPPGQLRPAAACADAPVQRAPAESAQGGGRIYRGPASALGRRA